MPCARAERRGEIPADTQGEPRRMRRNPRLERNRCESSIFNSPVAPSPLLAQRELGKIYGNAENRKMRIRTGTRSPFRSECAKPRGRGESFVKNTRTISGVAGVSYYFDS